MSPLSSASRRPRTRLAAAVALLALGISPYVVAQEPDATPNEGVAEEFVRAMWSNVAPEWKARLKQDETQAACSRFRDNPPSDIAASILAREAATIVLPKDGQVLGSWENGEKISLSGHGGRFSDGPDTVNGGNCYACHQMAPSELSFGTLGPSLTGYGKLRNFDPEAAKETYAKIYNSQATVVCSHMPRFGAHGFLTEQQIKDVTAYLFDPESPVNK